MKDTVNFKGFTFEFDVDHQPTESQTHWQPEVHEEFEIFNITLNGLDATELLESQIDEFEEAVMNDIKEQQENRY